MFPLLPVLLASLVLALLWRLIAPRGSRKTSAPLPPGPPADPIIGHLRMIPSRRPELTYMKWGKELNTDILCLKLLGKPTIILNSAKASIELLEKRGAKYSDRPNFDFLREQGFSENLALISMGPQFRKHRKMFQNAFTQTNCSPYKAAQEAGSRKLVGRILATPKNWQQHLVLYATTIILAIAYGITAKGIDDPYVELAEKISKGIADGGSAGATTVDVIPAVRYLPNWMAALIPSLNAARKLYPYTRSLYDKPFAAVQNNMAHGTAVASFVKKMLEEKDEQKNRADTYNPITDDDIKGAAVTIYTAGQDTTWTSLTMFVLNITQHPEFQQKAWKEIDAVTGGHRLPTFADRDKIPYVEYIMQETFRKHPVAPLGVPHQLSEDDYYEGYFIPAAANTNRSTIYANSYGMLRDETVYKDPDKFNPDRYIPKEQGGAGEPFPVGQFGFGRRICPGRHLASNSVWISIASILATFEISKAKDANGKEIHPDPEFTTGIVCHPEAFPSVLRPRSEMVRESFGA